MTRFRYEAIDINGEEQRGRLEAPSAAAGVETLQRRGLQMLAFEQVGPLHALRRLNPRRYTSIDLHDLVVLFRQLALMIRSGNTLLQGLQTAAALTEKRTLRAMLSRLITEIQNGTSFARALENQGHPIPGLVPNLIAFGETSGELQVTLEQLADYLERRAWLRRQFVSSLLYPTVVVGVALAVGLFLAIVIIPKFQPLLEYRAAELPATTVMLIDVSEWIVQYGLYGVAALAALVILTLAAYRTRPGKSVIDRILIDTPIVGTTIRNTEMAHMGWTLSLMMRAGITVQEALRVVSALMGNRTLSRCFQQAGEAILVGESLSLSLQQRPIPMMVRNMVGLGERSGELERVMQELGEYYRNVNEERFKRLMGSIEPAMVLVVGGVVAFVYFAFFTALFQLSTG